LKRRASPEAIARHYVGAVRDRFYGEGLKRLHEQLLAHEEE
jgi:nucleoside diphosphate kinase